jgi:hypothetical protein
MEDNELHPLVTLLLKRMDSHPEEFQVSRPRWDYAINAIKQNGSEADIDALDTKLRLVRLNAAHEWALDELLNGEERRKEQAKEREQKVIRQAASLIQNIEPRIVASETGTALLGDIALASPQAAANILGKLWKE